MTEVDGKLAMRWGKAGWRRGESRGKRCVIVEACWKSPEREFLVVATGGNVVQLRACTVPVSRFSQGLLLA